MRVTVRQPSRNFNHLSKVTWDREIIIEFTKFASSTSLKLFGLHPFYNLIITHWVKNRLKTERWAVSSWDTNPWRSFCDTQWELICRKKWYPGTSEIFTWPKIAVGTCFYAQHGKTIPVFLPAHGKASWLLPLSLVCLLPSVKVQP